MPDTLIHALDGFSFPAYAALPEGGHGAGLIVIHDMFGLSPAMRAMCDRYAARGYLVVCPDLYARQKGAAQDAAASMDLERASKLYKNFDVEAAVRDLLATLAHVRGMPGCGGRVGTLGFCLGGRLAFLMALRSDIDCAVGFDNVGIDSLLSDLYDIRVATLLHFGEQDYLMPAATRQRILSALQRNENVSPQLYAGADHGFALESSTKYHPEAAAKAQALTDSFLDEHLEV